MEVLKYYLVLAGLLEVVSFGRLVWTSTPFVQLLPTVEHGVFDTVPVVRRLYAVYVLTLGVLRLATARDMRNRSLFGVLAIVHVLETLFSLVEVVVYQQIPMEKMLTEEHALKSVMLAVLIGQMTFICTGYYRYCGKEKES